MNNIFRYDKVMIIDDSNIDRFVAEKMIRQTYFAEHILTVPSAQLALDYLGVIKDEESLPDIIFLDINMPGMTGFEFLERYRELPELIRRQSIVMLSSTISQKDIDKATADPYVITFMEKPVSAERLQML